MAATALLTMSSILYLYIMTDKFEITYSYKGQTYTGEVEFIQDNDMEPAFYRVWTTSKILDLAHDSNKYWRDINLDVEPASEVIGSDLIQKIGRAIEEKISQ
jgi:hypothetical protein